MKILFIQHASEMGGSLQSLFLTINALKEQQKDWDLWILCRDKNICEWYKKHGIKAYYTPLIGRLGHCSGMTGIRPMIKQLILLPIYTFYQFLLFKFHKDFKHADIIHLNSSVLFSSALAAFLSQKKCFWHIREVLSTGTWGIRKYFMQFVIQIFADKIICISPFEKSRFKPLSSYYESKFHIIYNFIEIDENTKNKHINDDKFTLLHLGGTNPIKGGDILLEACKILLISHPNIQVLWAGDPPGTHLANITAIGPIDSVQEYIKSSQAVYFGGTIPHFPRPIFEAFACSRPVIAFNIEGISSFVDNQVDGLLIEMNPQSLADAIQKYYDNPQLCMLFGKNGLEKKAQIFFTKKKNIQELINLYQSINFS